MVHDGAMETGEKGAAVGDQCEGEREKNRWKQNTEGNVYQEKHACLFQPHPQSLGTVAGARAGVGYLPYRRGRTSAL